MYIYIHVKGPYEVQGLDQTITVQLLRTCEYIVPTTRFSRRCLCASINICTTWSRLRPQEAAREGGCWKAFSRGPINRNSPFSRARITYTYSRSVTKGGVMVDLMQITPPSYI